MVRKFALIPIVLLAAMLGMEVLGVTWYFGVHGRWFYSRDRLDFDPHAVKNNRESRLNLHPYLGWVQPPDRSYRSMPSPKFVARQQEGGVGPSGWIETKTNRLGFLSGVEYPSRRKTERDFIIGIFGGSVANYFALQGRERLISGLRNTPYFKDRDLVVLNFAQDGYKQPQQSALLAFLITLGQPLDLVVNIDGFNEVAGGLSNAKQGVDPGMPSIDQFRSILEPMRVLEYDIDQLQLLEQSVQTANRLNEVLHRQASTRSAGFHLVLGLLQHRLESIIEQIGDAEPKRTSDSVVGSPFIALTDLQLGLNTAEPLDRVVDQWAEASLQMKLMSDSIGARYLEVIQPSLSFSGKNLTAEEHSLRLETSGRAGEDLDAGLIRLGYRRVPELIKKIRDSGVDGHSALALFDAEEQTVYADARSHYNQRGNDLMADFIARMIRARVNGE